MQQTVQIAPASANVPQLLQGPAAVQVRPSFLQRPLPTVPQAASNVEVPMEDVQPAPPGVLALNLDLEDAMAVDVLPPVDQDRMDIDNAAAAQSVRSVSSSGCNHV
jgi:hypothetical protein